jgi:3-oxoadipate enol-lactonase
MPIAKINGVNLYYEVSGKGPAVVFLHGMTGSTHDWANQVTVLSSKYKVVALDMRGHGKSSAPRTEAKYSIPIFAEDVFGLLKLLKIEKCCLVGHSIGGLIAIQFALSHKEKLAGLVLVDVPKFHGDPRCEELKLKAQELARSQGLVASVEYQYSHNPLSKEKLKKHPELKEVSIRKALMTSVDGYIYGGRAIENWQPAISRLSEISVRTQIYWGDEDTLTTAGINILKEGIQGSTLVTVHGAGHNPHEEAPEIFNQALIEFLGKVWSFKNNKNN